MKDKELASLKLFKKINKDISANTVIETALQAGRGTSLYSRLFMEVDEVLLIDFEELDKVLADLKLIDDTFSSKGVKIKA